MAKIKILQDENVARDIAKVDEACKRILSEKAVLAWIMKGCMKEYADVSVDEIESKYIEGEPVVSGVAVMPDETNNPVVRGTGTEDSLETEGTVFYDIRFFATAPSTKDVIELIVNVEAQSNFHPGYPLVKRALYYCSRMISAQHGTEFTNSHYERIKKVYSVWICIHPPKSRMNTLTSYSIEEHNHVGKAHEKLENYDLLTVVMICLGDKGNITESDVISLLNLLFVSERTEKEKQQLLESKFGMKMSNTFEKGVNSMCNYGEGIFAKGIREGRKEGRAEGRKEGRDEGRKEGRAEGRAEGRNAEKMETATNLRNLGVPVETISQATGLSPEQIAKL